MHKTHKQTHETEPNDSQETNGTRRKKKWIIYLGRGRKDGPKNSRTRGIIRTEKIGGEGGRRRRRTHFLLPVHTSLPSYMCYSILSCFVIPKWEYGDINRRTTVPKGSEKPHQPTDFSRNKHKVQRETKRKNKKQRKQKRKQRKIYTRERSTNL